MNDIFNRVVDTNIYHGTLAKKVAATCNKKK